MFGRGLGAKQNQGTIFGYVLFKGGNGCYERALLFREAMTEYNDPTMTLKYPPGN